MDRLLTSSAYVLASAVGEWLEKNVKNALLDLSAFLGLLDAESVLQAHSLHDQCLYFARPVEWDHLVEEAKENARNVQREL